MDLGLDVAEQGNWAVLAVSGEVDVATAPRLRERLVALVAEGHHRIVVDLDGVDFLDSTGLGVLVGALKRVRTHDGDLALVCTKPRSSRSSRSPGSPACSRSTTRSTTPSLRTRDQPTVGGEVELQFPAGPEYLALARLWSRPWPGADRRSRTAASTICAWPCPRRAPTASRRTSATASATGRRWSASRSPSAPTGSRSRSPTKPAASTPPTVAVHPPVTDPERLDFERGLGIPLMRALTDEAAFESSPGGTTVRLVVRGELQ